MAQHVARASAPREWVGRTGVCRDDEPDASPDAYQSPLRLPTLSVASHEYLLGQGVRGDQTLLVCTAVALLASVVCAVVALRPLFD